MYYNQYHNTKKNMHVSFTNKLSQNPDSHLPKSMRPIIPEPRHRVGPKGIVSSGISFRQLPEPSLQTVIDVCEHYESKCSGNYTSLASRYISQMSSEVRSLVNSIENDQKQNESTENWHQNNFRKDKKEIKELKNEMNKLQISLFTTKEEGKRSKQKAQEDRNEYKTVCKRKVESDRLHHESLLSKVKEESQVEIINANKNVERIKQNAKSTIRFLQKESNNKTNYCKSVEKIIQEQQIQEKKLKDKFNYKLNEIDIHLVNEVYMDDNENHVHKTCTKRFKQQFKKQSIASKMDTLRGLKGVIEQVSLNLKYKDLILDDDDDDDDTPNYIYG